MNALENCTAHPIHRDIMGAVPLCPSECDYWVRRREWCRALSDAMAKPAAPLNVPQRANGLIAPKTVNQPAIRREFLAPLIAEPMAKRALRLFAEGEITAVELEKRLMTASKRLANPATGVVVKDLTFRAVCARFGLPLGQGTEA